MIADDAFQNGRGSPGDRTGGVDCRGFARRAVSAAPFPPGSAAEIMDAAFRIGVIASGAVAGPELGAAVASLSAAGTAVVPATVGDPARLDALVVATSGATLEIRAEAALRLALAEGRPVAALGRGGVLALAAAGGLRGVRVAAPTALHGLLRAAGAQPIVAAAVADRGIVTGDGAAFVVTLLREFADEFASAPRRAPALADAAAMGDRIAT